MVHKRCQVILGSYAPMGVASPMTGYHGGHYWISHRRTAS